VTRRKKDGDDAPPLMPACAYGCGRKANGWLSLHFHSDEPPRFDRTGQRIYTQAISATLPACTDCVASSVTVRVQLPPKVEQS